MSPSHPGGSPGAIQGSTSPQHGPLAPLRAPEAPIPRCHPCTGTHPEPRTTQDAHGNLIVRVDLAVCAGHYQQIVLGQFPWLADEWAAERTRNAEIRADAGGPSLPPPELPGMDPDTLLGVITCPLTAASVAAVYAGTL